MSSPSLYVAIDRPDGIATPEPSMNDSFERLIYALPSIRGKELRELFKGTAIEKEFLHICDPEEVDAEALTWGGSIDLAAGLNGYPEPGNLPVGSRLLFFFVGW